MSDDSRLYAAGAYLLLIFSGVAVLLFRKGDAYAKFHAMQSILFTVALFIVSVAFSIVAAILGSIPFIGGFIGLLLFVAGAVVNLGALLLWLYLMWKAYTGERFRLPLIGEHAEKMAAKA